MDIFNGCGNGTLGASISHNLDPIGNTWDESKGDRWLDVCINDEDRFAIQSAMYSFIVGAPLEVRDHVFINWEANASQIISVFPMLNRIEQMYADALYLANEVSVLREECVKLTASTTSKAGDLAFRKLIYCCDEGIQAGFCLGFWCD